MLPGPRALALVVLETGNRGHQQPLGAVRAQAHVDVVQPAGAGGRAEQCDDLLRQPRAPARRIQCARAIRHRVSRRVVNEHDIEIGAESELATAEAAVTQHREAETLDTAVLGFQFAHREPMHGVEHRIGQRGEHPRGLHAVDAPVQGRQRDAETQRLARFVEREQRGFGIVLLQRGRARGVELVRARQRPGDAHIQQFVQQQRMRRQPFAQQCTAGERVDQPRQRRRLLVEQGEITGAAQDRVQHRQQAPQRQQRFGRDRNAGQQRGHQPVEPDPRGVGQIAHARRAREIAQQLVHRLDLLEAFVAQGVRCAGLAFAVAGLLAQRAPVRHQRVRLRRASARRQQHVEFAAHALAMHLQSRVQRCPVGFAQSLRQPRPRRRIVRQLLGLRVAQHLQPVFEQAQKTIRRDQSVAGVVGEMARIAQRAQRRLQAPFAQRGFAAAADQLQRLRQEFDLADPARAALDVLGHVLARDFGGDGRLHLAQAVERAVIEIAAVDERPQRVEEPRAGIEVASDRARLLPGVTLPVAAFALEIVLHRRKRHRDAPGGAERPQAQVDAMTEALGGDFVEQFRQLLAQAGEVILRRQRARAIAVAVLFVGVDQIDIRAEVQFAAAELAQREHHQPHRRSIGAAHHAGTLLELALQRRQPALQAVFGEARGRGQGLVQGVEALHVAPDQAYGFGQAEATQQGRPVGAVFDGQRRQRRSERAVVGEQSRQQRGLAQADVDREVAGHRQRADPRLHDCIVGQVRQRGAQARERAVGDGVKSGKRGVGVIHARILASGDSNAGNKKARPGRTGSGLAPSPTSGCAGIVKEALSQRTLHCKKELMGT